MDAILEFLEITKEYRGFNRKRRLVALDNFQISVQKGEIFGFLGPNGAGKTTAMHLAMGFTRPSRGSGRMLGHPFGHAAARRRVGFLSENVALYHRRAEFLVRFYGALNGMGGASLAKRAAEVLQLVGLQDDAQRNAGKFSRGMLQRVGLAQALVNDPDLLILDEPTSALDPHARVMVRELLISAREAGKTIFLSSHLLSEVELVCDRVAVLHRGKLVRLARTADLLQAAGQTEVVAKNIGIADFPDATCLEGAVHFRVPANNLRSAIERVWDRGGEIVSANPVRQSLEEIFLHVTSAPESAASKDSL